MGAAIAAGVAGLGSAALGVYASKQQSDIAAAGRRQQTSLANKAAGEREALSEQVRAESDIARQNLYAAEEARLKIGSMLGAPGTYESAPGSSVFGIAPQGIYGISTPGAASTGYTSPVTKEGTVAGRGILNKKTGIRAGTESWKVEGEVLDPTKLAASVTSQPQFAAVSRMVAEANQLMAREGPLWNELNNSVVGAIYGGAAARQREAMDMLSREAARGGTARNRALFTAQKMQAQENVNRARMGELWQARMSLEQFRTQAAQANLSYANAWVDNQAGIRDNVNAALTSLRTMWSQTMAPIAAGATSTSQKIESAALTHSNDALLDANAAKWAAISGGTEALISSIGSGIASYRQEKKEGGTP